MDCQLPPARFPVTITMLDAMLYIDGSSSPLGNSSPVSYQLEDPMPSFLFN